MVDIRQHDIALGVELRPLHEVGQVLLQNAGGAGGGEHNQVGVLFLVFAEDVVHHFFLRPTSQHVAIHNAGSDGGKVSLPLQHGPHDVEIVVSQGRMHDGVHVLEGTCDPQGANVRRTGIHPVGQFHTVSLLGGTSSVSLPKHPGWVANP